MADDQKLFNSYQPPQSSDPDEAWKANVIRPITRNKIISIAAHVLATVLKPSFFAQNKQDEEDKQAAQVMEDLIEWVIQNSNYEESYLFGVVSMLVNPAVILKSEYAEVLREVRIKHDDGTIDTKKAVDELLSGFTTQIIPCDELFISNIYEFHMQKQRFLVRRRFIEYEEAELLYGDHENFEHVKPGVVTLYSEEDERFYEQKDDSLENLVEEATYYNRYKDLELTFVNGIIVSSHEQPMKHRRQTVDDDGESTTFPVYPFAKSGSEPIDERKFFYYKSFVSKLAPEQDIIDIMYNMVIDGTFLSLFSPKAVYGGEEITGASFRPGGIEYFQSPDSKMENLYDGRSLNAGYNALQYIEKSMSESSQSELKSGIPLETGRTAFEISRLEQNARVQLGLLGKMIGFLVRDYGELLVDDVLMHLTVADADKLLSAGAGMSFRTFLVPNKTEDGKKITRKIDFTPDLERGFTESQIQAKQYDLLNKEGGMDGEQRIIQVNPMAFRQLKFKTYVAPDILQPKNEYMEKAQSLEAYDRMIQNPYVDQEAVTRDFLVDLYADGESQKYMKDQLDQGQLPVSQPNKQDQKTVSMGNMMPETEQSVARQEMFI